MSHSENPAVEDPPEAEWIDRCALAMGEFLTGLSPEHISELAADVWRDARGHLSPEHAGREEVWAQEDLSGLPAGLIGLPRPPNTADKAAWVARFGRWLFAFEPTLGPEAQASMGDDLWEELDHSTTPEDAAVLLARSWQTQDHPPS